MRNIGFFGDRARAQMHFDHCPPSNSSKLMRNAGCGFKCRSTRRTTGSFFRLMAFRDWSLLPCPQFLTTPSKASASTPADTARRLLGPSASPRYVRNMCGRARLSSDVSEIKLVFSIPPERPTPNFRQAGTSRRPTLCPSSATTPRPRSAASTCCAVASSLTGPRHQGRLR